MFIIGKLIGRYYNEQGVLTEYGKTVKTLINNAEKLKESHEKESIKYPSCNIEWDAVQGTHVWCSNKR